VSELLRRAFEEFEPLYTQKAFAATVQSQSGVLKRMEEGPMWVAESHTGIVGTVAAVCSSDLITLRGMAVSPQTRGLGVGRTLLDSAEEFARMQRVNHISLYTTAFLRSAIRLYQTAGFEFTQTAGFEFTQTAGFEFTGESARPHGTDLLLMKKILN
jgi:ribosomal protein S18 acetylase RimI-like enzyme